MNTDAAKEVLRKAVSPLATADRRWNQVARLIAVGTPVAAWLTDQPGWLVAVSVLGVPLVMVSVAAYRTEKEVLASHRSFLAFRGAEIGIPVRLDRRVDTSWKATREHARSIRITGDETDPLIPLRALYANDPPGRIRGMDAERVWAEITFVDSQSNPELTIGGRWTSEPQSVDASLSEPMPLSTRPEAGYIDFPPNARPEPLDVAFVRQRTGELLVWDAHERIYPLKEREYRVEVTLRCFA